MSERITLFVDIILPISLSNEFTYRVPFEMNDTVQLFTRVIVPFGKGKFYTGIVTHIHSNVPTLYQAKYIEHILDDTPLIGLKHYQFWKWITQYYMAPIGDVMNAALPANFKLASETKVALHPDFDEKNTLLDDREFLIIEALSMQEKLDLKEISEIVGIKTIQPIIKRLIEKRAVLTQEELNNKFTAKTALFVVLQENYRNERALNRLFEELSNKKTSSKQEEVLLHLLKLGGFQNGKVTPILRKELEEEGCSLSAMNTLEKNGVILFDRLEISRIQSTQLATDDFPELSLGQQQAYRSIQEQLHSKDTVLLHGITGSGKTELYIHLIENALKKGKQILFLIPEIALTTQLIQRLTVYFGKQIGVYHSRFNANERVEIWNKVLANDPNEFRIVVGARSAVFLPFQDLGLVIVDEEHESSYKQHDPSPRYNARDIGIVLAHYFKAKTVLGSATPSIESYQNAQEGKYGYVALNERYSQVLLPEIFCADMKKERVEKTVNGHFSSFLLTEIKAALERNEQIILFQNRRGYTPIWTCELCGFSPNCKNCDTTLNYHKHANILKCHHCSYQIPPIGTCPACGSNRLKMLGFGTEKLEDDLALLLPDVRIGRMDFDTTRNKNGYLKIIQAFENRTIDILIGTQMIAKGLDFNDVGLVGILDADMMLNKTDFRAFERSFQLMSQVAGRSGRRNKRGRVIIQTGNPEHWVIQQVIAHNYTAFASNEIIERRNYHYPPFYKLIKFTLKHRDRDLVSDAANQFSQQLRAIFQERVLGPEFPVIARIQNYFLKEIILKIEHEAPQKKVKERLHELIDQFYSNPSYRSIRLIIDVDPN